MPPHQSTAGALRRGGSLALLPVLLAAVCLGSVASVAAPAAAVAKPKKQAKLAVIYGVTGKRTLHVSGVVRGARRGYRATLETRAGKRFRVRKAARVRRGGRFAMKWRYPARASRLRFRVRVLRSRGARRAVAVGSWRSLRVRGSPRRPSVPP